MYSVFEMEVVARERQRDLECRLRRRALLAEALCSRTPDAARSEHGDMIARALHSACDMHTALLGKLWRKAGWAQSAGQSGMENA